MTKVPATITYASVVLRETVIIALMVITLNDLEIKLADILNAYIQALVTEKVWAMLSPEFSKGASRMAVIVRALYGINSARAIF